MAQAKLHINISQGLIDVEGDEGFVKYVYDDFKEQLLNSRPEEEGGSLGQAADNQEREVASAPVTTPPRKKKRVAKATSESPSANGGASYSPQQDKDIELARLSAFYSNYTPKNHSDKILIFVKFLEEELKIKPCTADQVYTCYRFLREKVPEAFVQAFRDAANQKRFIKFNSVTHIETTLVGDNHFDHELAKTA